MGQQTETRRRSGLSLGSLKTFVAVRMRLLQDGYVDRRLGGDTGAYITSRLSHLGAHDCGTCHYSAMFKVFKNQIRPEDVLVDVGSGFGRAINTWLWMGCKKRRESKSKSSEICSQFAGSADAGGSDLCEDRIRLVRALGRLDRCGVDCRHRSAPSVSIVSVDRLAAG